MHSCVCLSLCEKAQTGVRKPAAHELERRLWPLFASVEGFAAQGIGLPRLACAHLVGGLRSAVLELIWQGTKALERDGLILLALCRHVHSTRGPSSAHGSRDELARSYARQHRKRGAVRKLNTADEHEQQHASHHRDGSRAAARDTHWPAHCIRYFVGLHNTLNYCRTTFAE